MVPKKYQELEEKNEQKIEKWDVYQRKQAMVIPWKNTVESIRIFWSLTILFWRIVQLFKKDKNNV